MRTTMECLALPAAEAFMYASITGSGWMPCSFSLASSVSRLSARVAMRTCQSGRRNPGSGILMQNPLHAVHRVHNGHEVLYCCMVLPQQTQAAPSSASTATGVTMLVPHALALGCEVECLVHLQREGGAAHLACVTFSRCCQQTSARQAAVCNRCVLVPHARTNTCKPHRQLCDVLVSLLHI